MPFEELDKILVDLIIEAGNRYLVVQRFAWPSFPITKSFMASAYKDLKLASDHLSQLKSNEGKLIHLDSGAANLISAINSKQFSFFFNMFKEEEWEAKILEAYKSNIIKNIKSKTALRSSEKLDITLIFEYGRLMAHVLVKDKKLIFPANDLLK